MTAPLDVEIAAPIPLAEWLTVAKRCVDDAMIQHFAAVRAAEPQQSRLLEAVEYSLTQGGKRVRPILVLEAAAACDGQAETAMPAAIAMECVHTFSLIHDDLPAMDDDDLRRGVPTNHKVFGEALAVLAGDWLLAHALELLVKSYPGATGGMLAADLASGTKGMIAGQAADISGEELPADGDLVRFIHRHKTAALIQSACRMGATTAGAAPAQRSALSAYGLHLGLAFQIMDDILDLTATTAQLGKRAAKDAEAGKQTYPAACGLDESRRQARQEADAALAALRPLGARSERLAQIAEFVVAREN